MRIPTWPSQSTLSRLENTVTRADVLRVSRALLDQFLDRCGADPQWIVLDLDPFADPCHGHQQLSLFSGHYDTHCYLPLYLGGRIDGSRPYVIGALLRDGRAPATEGRPLCCDEWWARSAPRFPRVKILVRGDGAFGVPEMIQTCRALDVRFLFGKPQNARLHALSEREQLRAAVVFSVTKRPHREFGEFRYRAESWAREERVIVKAEVTSGKLNPRFVVTDLSADDGWTVAGGVWALL